MDRAVCTVEESDVKSTVLLFKHLDLPIKDTISIRIILREWLRLSGRVKDLSDKSYTILLNTV